jgi:L-malate glycosyltransferase
MIPPTAGRSPVTMMTTRATGLRVCFVAPGANTHTRRWANAMCERGHDVLLIAREPALPVAADLFDPYLEMGLLRHLPKVRVLIAERLILRRLGSFSPDLVHFHWLNATLSDLRLARRVRPLVVSVWGSDVIWDGSRSESPLRAYCKSRILAAAREVTATSTFLARQTQRWMPAGRMPVVVPFGVDCRQFSPKVPRPERPLPVIGYLKHYLPKYGPDVLLRAASLLVRAGVQFRAEMYGWMDPEPYRRLAHGLGLDACVRIAGSLAHERVPDAMRGFDIFAMPSLYESFGVAALEASACGVPVVASRVGGVPETVIDGKTGLLVRPADPESLAQALATLIHDRSLRVRLGDAGREFVAHSYGWETCVRKMEDLYVRILESSPLAEATNGR